MLLSFTWHSIAEVGIIIVEVSQLRALIVEVSQLSALIVEVSRLSGVEFAFRSQQVTNPFFNFNRSVDSYFMFGELIPVCQKNTGKIVELTTP